MSHELDMTTGRAAMAYVGDEPWHGLGQQLEVGASIETWTEAAGLNWDVNEATVEFTIADTIKSFDSRKVLYRSDTQNPLSVVSTGYRTVQPSTIMNFFRTLSDKTDAQMEAERCLT